MNWQPIETAPKDGTIICVWPPTWEYALSCAYWDNDEYATRARPFWRRLDADMITLSRKKQPTHWAPVPDGPNE